MSNKWILPVTYQHPKVSVSFRFRVSSQSSTSLYFLPVSRSCPSPLAPSSNSDSDSESEASSLIHEVEISLSVCGQPSGRSQANIWRVAFSDPFVDIGRKRSFSVCGKSYSKKEMEHSPFSAGHDSLGFLCSGSKPWSSAEYGPSIRSEEQLRYCK